jgi:hypothetical protein
VVGRDEAGARFFPVPGGTGKDVGPWQRVRRGQGCRSVAEGAARMGAGPWWGTCHRRVFRWRGRAMSTHGAFRQEFVHVVRQRQGTVGPRAAILKEMVGVGVTSNLIHSLL